MSAVCASREFIGRRADPEVARWIVSNTRFDRLYFYGPDRPIHVSAAREPNREIVLMREIPSGRRVPRVVEEGVFLADDLL